MRGINRTMREGPNAKTVAVVTIAFCLTGLVPAIYLANTPTSSPGSSSFTVLNNPGIHIANVQISTFENWSTSWQAASVEICMYEGTGCVTFTNGQTAVLSVGDEYELVAVPYSGFSAWEWTTNAGSLSSSTSSPTYFTVSSSGTLSLIVASPATAITWLDGYLSSSSGPSGFTSVSGLVQLPGVPGISTGFNIEIGFNGLPNTNTFSDGILFSGGDGTWTVGAYYEACVDAITCINGVNAPPSFQVLPGDQIEMSVSISGTQVTFAIDDLTSGSIWTGSITFSPCTQSAAFLTLTGVGVPYVRYTDLQVNNAPASLEGNYLAELTSGAFLSQLTNSGGYPAFMTD